MDTPKNPDQHIRFFDFDLTMTCCHTFSRYQLMRFPEDRYDIGTEADQYQYGKNLAKSNCKQGLTEHFKHDDDNNCAAILTFHNNPALIAGFVAGILGKELRHIRTGINHHLELGVSSYTIEGIQKPFRICFVALEGYSYRPPCNKNDQIILTKARLETQGYFSSGKIDFFDDDQDNIEGAHSLDYLNCHLVEGHSPVFKFESRANSQPQAVAVESEAADNKLLLLSTSGYSFLETPAPESIAKGSLSQNAAENLKSFQ